MQEVCVPPGLAEVLSSFGCRAVAEIHLAVLEQLGGTYESLTDLWGSASSRLQVSDATDDEIRSWFRSLPVDAESAVRVDWARDGVGVEIPFSVFVQHFDDLWYPSSDDVVVLCPDGAVIFLDHEERFSYTAGQPTTAGYRPRHR